MAGKGKEENIMGMRAAERKIGEMGRYNEENLRKLYTRATKSKAERVGE